MVVEVSLLRRSRVNFCGITVSSRGGASSSESLRFETYRCVRLWNVRFFYCNIVLGYSSFYDGTYKHCFIMVTAEKVFELWITLSREIYREKILLFWHIQHLKLSRMFSSFFSITWRFCFVECNLWTINDLKALHENIVKKLLTHSLLKFTKERKKKKFKKINFVLSLWKIFHIIP
jgi:hypothetical protein